MSDFSSARENMVVSQLHPNGVVSDSILEAYRSIPREMFVPEDKRGVCYADDDIRISPSRCLMEPQLYARMVEAAEIDSNDRVLDVGGGSGFSAAILSKLCATVISFESDAVLQAQAKSSWAKVGCKNIATTDSLALAQGPFDVIILNGACEKVPQMLLDMLRPQGRLIAIEMGADQPAGQAKYYLKNDKGIVSSRPLFDAATAYLPGFTPQQKFVF